MMGRGEDAGREGKGVYMGWLSECCGMMRAQGRDL